MKHQRASQGFTPIELLFVVLLIGILALTAVSFLNTSRERARDAKRLVDVRRIQTALEFYELEYDAYPVVDQPIVLGGAQAAKLCDQEAGGFVPAATTCATEFITLPKDPESGKAYRYIGAANGYTIEFTTETTTDLGEPGTFYAHPQALNTSPDIQ